jgi:hypothetical protein
MPGAKTDSWLGIIRDRVRCRKEQIRRTIFQSNLPHVILIDDARLFDGTGGYPTIAHLQEFLGERGYLLAVEDDIVRLTPEKDKSRSTQQ